MGLLDKIKSQKNEVKYSIVDKKIMIGGFNGSGKTSLLHEMSNIIAEETGNNEAVLVLPLENRYAPYVDFRKYITPELDFYNKDEKLRKNVIFQAVGAHFYFVAHTQNLHLKTLCHVDVIKDKLNLDSWCQ